MKLIMVDGGWFRGTDGNFYCWDGFDCDGNPNGVGGQLSQFGVDSS